MNTTTGFFLFILFIIGNICTAQKKPDKEFMDHYQEAMKRTEWWSEARFDMFIHFGAYAVAGRGQSVKSNEHLTTEQYQKYIDAFYPADFDAKKWARIAKAAGMKYAVLTAKHHDGYCMFDSKLTDYKVSKQFDGRDIVREFLDAFRAEGIRIGLYYSLIDWHHPDYPNVLFHPQENDKEYSKREFNWDNYLKYMHGQVEELAKNYGKIDIMWFDYSFDIYTGEKWKAKELDEMVRKYQPEVIIDNRLGLKYRGTNILPIDSYQNISDKPIRVSIQRTAQKQDSIFIKSGYGIELYNYSYQKGKIKAEIGGLGTCNLKLHAETEPRVRVNGRNADIIYHADLQLAVVKLVFDSNEKKELEILN